MEIEKRIEQRKKVRAVQSGRLFNKNALKMLCAICDDYLEHRIRTDKVQEGVLKDIQFDIASINVRQEIKGTIADTDFEKEKVMSKETKLTHAAQVLLQAAEKAFEDGSRIRGLSLVKDSLVLLGNGYDRFTRETTQEPTESEIKAMDQPAESEKDTVDQPASERVQAANEVSGRIEERLKDRQPSESSNEPKPDAGVVSDPDKSQNRDVNGVT